MCEIANGIYHVLLSSSGGTREGIVVIDRNTINGGSLDYVLQGRLVVENMELSGTVFVKKWNDRLSPALGLFKEVTVKVRGKYDHQDKSFNFEGLVNGHHVVWIMARGRFLAHLTRQRAK